MKSKNNRIFLEDVVRSSATSEGVDFVDITQTQFHIPMKLLVNLYEGAKYTMEKKGVDWEKFCNELFSGSQRPDFSKYFEHEKGHCLVT